jgi:hypothetical protein
MSSLLSEIHVEYLVREDGERTGVVLNWQDFQKLRARLEADPDLLVGLDVETLSAIANGMLSAPHQQQLDALLERNRTDGLAPEERSELDQLLDDIDRMNLLKARAIYTLKQVELQLQFACSALLRLRSITFCL